MKKFRIGLLCSLLLLIFGCSPKISNYFDSTRYVDSFNTHILNDSLKLYLKTPADIQYEQNRDSLQKHLRDKERKYENILAYGKTIVPPHYELYIMLNPNKILKAKNEKEFARDTLINNNRLVIFCQSTQKSFTSSFKSDCKQIFESISTDKNYRDEISSMFNLAKRTGHRYYQALNTILNYPVKGRNQKFLQLQMALNFASFLAPASIYNKLLNKFPTPPANDSLKQIIKSESIQGYKKTQQRIFREAQNHQLVMVSENHFYPNHRKVLTSWLPKFKEIGFTHLALEALGTGQDSLLNKGQPPTINTGFYTKDPRFAELIRMAQNLGFTFVSYESTNLGKNREKAQASNLFNKTFAQNDTARVLVLSGLDHILEQPDYKGKSWLAHILHQKYDLNPLTISQSHLNNYHSLGKPIALLKNSHLKKGDQYPVDWHLLNNLPLHDQNPNFSYYNTYDKKVQVALFLKSEIEPAMNFEDKIPYRTGLVSPDKKIGFQLPDENFFMVVYNKRGQILLKKESIRHN